MAVAPAWVLTYIIVRNSGTGHELLWTLLSVGVGLLALAAAWFGGEHFVLRPVGILNRAARLLAAGDLNSRTGLAHENDELGDLARTFDAMAATLEQRVKERDEAEKTLLIRALQQTVISALGECALLSADLQSVLEQAIMLCAQTLEVEYCCLLQIDPATGTLVMQAGAGWKAGTVGEARISAERDTQAGFTLQAGEPVVSYDSRSDKRFRMPPLLQDHGVISSMTVPVAGHGEPYGVLGAHTARPRMFTEDEVHFVHSVGTVVAMAVARKHAEAQLEKLAAFARLNPNPAMELGPEGTVGYWNDAAMRLTRAVGVESPHELLPGNVASVVKTALDGGGDKVTLETQLRGRTLAWSFHPVAPAGVVHAYVEDVTDRLSLQSQLRHSQKM